jgi:hypothetical protein
LAIASLRDSSQLNAWDFAERNRQAVSKPRQPRKRPIRENGQSE